MDQRLRPADPQPCRVHGQPGVHLDPLPDGNVQRLQPTPGRPGRLGQPAPDLHRRHRLNHHPVRKSGKRWTHRSAGATNRLIEKNPDFLVL